MDDEYLYRELKNISNKQSSMEAHIEELKTKVDKIGDWKDDVLIALQTCKYYMEANENLPQEVKNLTKSLEKLKDKTEGEEEQNKEVRKDTKFLMSWYLRLSGLALMITAIGAIYKFI